MKRTKILFLLLWLIMLPLGTVSAQGFVLPTKKTVSHVKKTHPKVAKRPTSTKSAKSAKSAKRSSSAPKVSHAKNSTSFEELREQAEEESKNKIFDECDQMPSFPGNLMTYLSENIKYPVEAQENGIQGRVVVSFVVEKDGSLSDMRVARSVSPELDAEALRVVSSMPKWNPGMNKGKYVRVKFNVPVSFRIQ